MAEKSAGPGVWGMGIAAGVCAAGSCFVIGYVAGRHGWASEVTASWIQSLGAITAIAAGFAVVNYQHWINSKAKDDEVRKAAFQRLEHVSAVVSDAVAAIRESTRLFSGGSIAIDAHTVRLEDSRYALRTLLDLPLNKVVVEGMLLILRDTSRCIQDLRQFNRLYPAEVISGLTNKVRFKAIPEARLKQYLDRLNRVEDTHQNIVDVVRAAAC